VTEMRFDDDAEVPKLFFRATRPLSDDELDAAVALRGTEAVNHAIEFKVFETDKVEQTIPVDRAGRPMEDAEGNRLAIEDREAIEKATAPPEKKKTKAKVTKIKAEVVEDDEPVVEPTKVEKKAAPEPDEEKEDLAKMINGWDD
jgi:hypothetical protein